MLWCGFCIDVVEKNVFMCVVVGVWLCGLIVKYCGYLWLNSVEHFIVLMVFSLFFIGDFGNFFLCYLCWKVVMVFSIIYVVN